VHHAKREQLAQTGHSNYRDEQNGGTTEHEFQCPVARQQRG
jgi:hypothetical protein